MLRGLPSIATAVPIVADFGSNHDRAAGSPTDGVLVGNSQNANAISSAGRLPPPVATTTKLFAPDACRSSALRLRSAATPFHPPTLSGVPLSDGDPGWEHDHLETSALARDRLHPAAYCLPDPTISNDFVSRR